MHTINMQTSPHNYHYVYMACNKKIQLYYNIMLIDKIGRACSKMNVLYANFPQIFLVPLFLFCAVDT